MFWNIEAGIEETLSNFITAPEYLTVFAADKESAEARAKSYYIGTWDCPFGFEVRIMSSVKVTSLREFKSLVDIKEAVDEALTHGLKEEFIDAMYELTKGECRCQSTK